MKFQSLLYKSFLLFFAVLSNVMLFAQPTAPPPGGGGSTGSLPPCWQPECVPIDGGVGFLIIAGVALGAKKIHDTRSKSRA